MKIITTKDIELRKKLFEMIKENDGHCPCRINKTADTKCMCLEFREKIERKEKGLCHCGLYEIIEVV